MAKQFIDESILNGFALSQDIDIGKYRLLKYPKLLSMMKMHVKLYKADHFGYIMMMKSSMLHLMSLTTISFTPSEGLNVPYLLIDTISMGKKRLAYVEFYNTSTKDDFDNLFSLSEKYKCVSDYDEKKDWYVSERMKGSLIKCGTKENEKELKDMILDALQEYKKTIDCATRDEKSIEKLKVFQNKMISLGNPSSNTLNKVLGKGNAVQFFKDIIMPIKD